MEAVAGSAVVYSFQLGVNSMGIAKVLLAKKPKHILNPVEEETLIGHTSLVCEMADLFTEELVPFIKTMLNCDMAHMESWCHSVWIGAWIHDWGKANSHFQKMFLDSSFRQGVRHETISLALTHRLNDWLAPLWDNLPIWARAAAIFAASGHHLKFPDPMEDKRPGTKVIVYLEHNDFKSVLKLGQQRYALGTPDLTDFEYSLLTRGDLKKILRTYQREMDYDFSELEKVLIATVKSTVMASDLAGSALPFKVEKPRYWLEKRLGSLLTKKQLQQVVHKKLGGNKPKSFQEQISNNNSNTILVEAGCGSGKTAAAYLWAARHTDGKRLFFCYPTTATASEGFSGYLYEPDFDALLVHSRSQVDYRLLENMPKPNREEIELKIARIEALETWPIPAVVCTAHTVLGLLENVRRGLYAWPSLAKSVFVFDEIHAFSDRLFSYLLRFVKIFSNVPMLLMTATLPPARKNALENVCSTRGGLQIISGPQIREEAKRYRMYKIDRTQVWGQVEKTIQCGGKVLWVCNTVMRAINIAEEAQKHLLPVQLYHSRYRYKDRLKHQRTVVDGFLPEKPAMLAVTTQVAEMSLDLSADLLITEWAPIPAMIQRMGRLNRFEEVPMHSSRALFISPQNRQPYTTGNDNEDDILWDGITSWLDSLCDGEPKSQREIAQAFIAITERTKQAPEPIAYCAWIDGLWCTLKDQRSIEEAGYTVEIIREEDLEEQSPVENAIPMPFPVEHDWKAWHREGRYLVAPKNTIHYDFFKGAIWKKN